MSRRRKDEFERSVEQDERDDASRDGTAPPRANIEALREIPREPVRVTDFATNHPGVGVQKRCGTYPHGCGAIIVGNPADHVCERGRYAGRRRG